MDSSKEVTHRTLKELQQECLEDSERWFPGLSKEVAYTCLCLAGEVGELCNIVKKVGRGSLTLNEKVHMDIVMEATDVLTYLLLLFEALGVDSEECYNVKREINNERFNANGN